MADLRTIAQDPDFQKLPIEEQRKAFVEYDKDFASLPQPEQDKGILDLTKPLQQTQPIKPLNQGYGDILKGINEEQQRYKDIVNTGLNTGASNVLGMPVDIANTVLGVVGLGSETPYMGSKNIRETTNPNPVVAKGFGETLIQKGAELAPGFIAPPIANAAIKSEALLPELYNALKLWLPTTIGGAIAKSVAPDNPYVEVAAEVAGTLVGSKSLPKIQGVIDLGKKLSYTIQNGMEKGVGIPSRLGKTAPQTQDFYNKSERAVSLIMGNRDKIELQNYRGDIRSAGSLPESNHEFSQAIDQTKRELWKQVDSMKKAASGKGIVADVTPAASELEQFADIVAPPILNAEGNVIGRIGSESAKHAARNALQQARDLRAKGTLTLDEIEQQIKTANAETKAFQQNPHYQGVSSMAVENLKAMHFRRAMDKAVTSTEGTGFQPLKNDYGSLLHIEDEVGKRAAVSGRGKPFGFFGYGNIWTGAEMASAFGHLVTGNVPAAITTAGRGVGIAAMSEWIKHRNMPDTAIKGMFRQVDAISKQLPKKLEPFIPESTGDLRDPLRKDPYNPNLAQPFGQPYNVPRSGGGLPVPSRIPSQELVPTGITRNIYPPADALPMPSSAEMLSRHPMGSRSLVPTGIARDIYPPSSALPSQLERLSITNRRIEPGGVIREPVMNQLELDALRKKMIQGGSQ
jgi:hypothetical protein